MRSWQRLDREKTHLKVWDDLKVFLKLISHFEAPRVATWIIHLIPVARISAAILCLAMQPVDFNSDAIRERGSCLFGGNLLAISKQRAASSCKWLPGVESARNDVTLHWSTNKRIYLLCFVRGPRQQGGSLFNHRKLDLGSSLLHAGATWRTT